MNAPQKGSHIASIDGLRAISVLAVIAYHYLPDLKSAGYLGVDVFFVISGFVITASIANYETPQSLKAFGVEFYLRRFKRLLPALFAVVFFTSILVMLVTTEGKDNMRTGALSLIGGANIFLYIKEADYFALTSELNPFTHMWSLAVEDQFYLLFPFLLWGAAFFSLEKSERNTDRLFKLLVILCIASLAGFTALFDFDYSFSFYMMPTRFWQIGAGILAYLLVTRSDRFVALKNIPLTVLVLALMGILAFGHLQPLLAHIGITFITVLTLMHLWYAQDHASVLSMAAPVYIGKISYSLYLWHWPFIVLAKHTVGTSYLMIALCLGLTILFAIASYHFIEKPFRNAKIKQAFAEKEKLFRTVLTSVIVSVLVLYIGVSRYAPKENNLLAITLGVPPIPEYSRHRCHGIGALKKFDDPLKACLGNKRTQAKPHKVYLLGDSHANQFVRIMNEILETTPYQLQFINAESNQQGVSGLISRPDFIPLDFAFMLEDAKPNDVFILSFHRGRLNERMDHHLNLNQAVKPNDFSQNFTSNLMGILKRLDKQEVEILLMYDTPLMASVTTAQSCAIQTKLGNDNLCKVARAQDIHTRKRQEIAYEQFKQSMPTITTWDPLPVIYGESSNHDILDANDEYLMQDWSHISETLAMELKPDLAKKLSQVLSSQ